MPNPGDLIARAVRKPAAQHPPAQRRIAPAPMPARSMPPAVPVFPAGRSETGIYQGLMRQHDRMTPRHLPDHRQEGSHAEK